MEADHPAARTARGGLHGAAVRWLVPLVGTAVAISALFWLYRGLDVDAFITALERANPFWLVVLAATILLEQLLRGWKWRQILFDLKPISSLRLFGAILAGYGVAILVPLGISPLVRAWLIARLEDLRMASVLVTTGIERFVDGIVFALIAGLVALAGQIPNVQGSLRFGLAFAGGLNLILFAAALWGLFAARRVLRNPQSRLGRAVDWLAARGGGRLEGMRAAILAGIVWPHERWRQAGVVAASFGMKGIAATHFLWAGLAVGVRLTGFDYLFLMVFAGFALVLARFVRVPGGFVIGSGFALKILGAPDAQALAMITSNHVMTIVLMVGVGLVVLWRSGLSIRSARAAAGSLDVAP